jgi:osmoprotectant transport system permease protein
VVDTPPIARWRIDRLSALLGVLVAGSAALLPFVVFKSSRIASGRNVSLIAALGPAWGGFAVAALVAAALGAACIAGSRSRLACGLGGLGILAVVVARAADSLTPAGNRIVRISPGIGCWLILLAFALISTNALSRFRLRPLRRVACLAAAAVLVYAAFAGGLFDGLSVMREYVVNESTFWHEGRRHLALALGSLLAAVAAGLPLGIVCHREPRLRTAILQCLNLLQTIPAIALFGILMVPLATLAAAVPALGALGVRGIGAAPAECALFLYSLLPIVANTTVGLGRVSPATIDAARGIGLDERQVLTEIEFALAMPVIVTGIRIVLVQNIGLVTIAALIGGGGFGTFVFQGVGQTAIDLVLLGAIPTVALAFVGAIVLDAVVELLGERTGAT